MNALYSQFKTDPNLERNGVIVQYLSGDDEVDKAPPSFVLARAGGANVAYDTMMEEKMKPIRRRLMADNVANKEIEAITREVVSKTVVKGWSNVKDEKGNVIEFSQNAALELFKALPDLYEDLRQQASKISLYRAANLEATAKNL